jgi:hypothetical protein
MVSARELVGRKIVGFRPNPFGSGRPEAPVAHDPVIVLDDDSCLTFTTEETEVGEYGIHITRHQPKRPKEV